MRISDWSSDVCSSDLIGLFGGWGARCYAPDGTLLHHIEFPVSNVTKIALGGPDLKTAYATTAAKGLSEDELARQPLAGGLFAFTVEIPGEIGRASCRERVCPVRVDLGGRRIIKKKKTRITQIK